MKKYVFFIIASLFTMGLMAQRQVAVYVTGPETLDTDTKEIFANELVNGIMSNKDFRGIERTADFARELAGSADNDRLCAIGQRLGTDLVCVAEITSFRDSYYIKSRLLDVRTKAVVNSASEASALATLDDILKASERLAGRLLTNVEKVEEEYSRVGQMNKRNCDIICIDNTGAQTVVTFKIMDAKGIRWSLSPTTVLIDRATDAQYKLVSVRGISTERAESYGVGIHEFSATFEKLPYSATKIDIIEPKGWEWKDIELNNFGRVGYHQFYDETQKKWSILMKEQELMKRQEARVGQIVNIEQSYRSYLLTFTNEQYGSAYIIELEGKKLGTVEKRSTLTFRLAPETYGKVKAIQRDGWLISPSIYKFDVPPMRPTDEISFTIPRP